MSQRPPRSYKETKAIRDGSRASHSARDYVPSGIKDIQSGRGRMMNGEEPDMVRITLKAQTTRLSKTRKPSMPRMPWEDKT